MVGLLARPAKINVMVSSTINIVSNVGRRKEMRRKIEILSDLHEMMFKGELKSTMIEFKGTPKHTKYNRIYWAGWTKEEPKTKHTRVETK